MVEAKNPGMDAPVHFFYGIALPAVRGAAPAGLPFAEGGVALNGPPGMKRPHLAATLVRRN